MKQPQVDQLVLPTYNHVRRASERLKGLAERTPVLTNKGLDREIGARFFLKAESFQHTGSFKYRGATNALLSLTDEEKALGVLTFSSGNHAQGIARAAKEQGIKAVIVMPDDAPVVKRKGAEAYGAEVIGYDRNITSREDLAASIQAERNLHLIPPYNHPDIIAGQGTAAQELLEDVAPLNALFVCVGGGGLLSGCALIANYMAPHCRLIGVEPEAGDDATRSFHSGQLHSVENPDTIADGARTSALGSYTFPIIRRHVHDMMTVTDRELAAAMFYLMETFKVVVEPTGALAFAGAMKRRKDLANGRIGVIISGGNLDFGRIDSYRRIAFS